MTGPTPEPPESPSPSDEVLAPADRVPDPASDAASEGPQKLATFSLEGRRVPALYLVGWVGSVMGAAVLLVSFMSTGTAAARWLFLAGLVVLGLGLIAAAGSQAIERGHRAELAYRGPSPVLTFVVAIALTLVGILVVLAPLSALGLDATTPFATTISLALTMLAYVVVVRLLVVGPGSLSWAEMGVRRPDGVAMRELLVGAVFALPVLLVTIALSLVLGTFLERTPSPLPASGDLTGLLFNLLSAAVLAPIGEEIFFRGFATTAWARSLGRAWPAIIRGAVFFAFAHVLTLFDASFGTGAQRALFSFLALLPAGIALGWLFLARRSLYAAIGLHGAFNGIQVLLAFAAAGALAQ
ncbi:MAG TPA: type II CAAX endopeptidase family protein [Candidatus Limnocylindrales bacterium]|nr:type II CAAX endopeptidase family protein [Candidatus Limnocylindrales bacterium]